MEKMFNQEYDINYEKTFVPMAWLTYVRSLFVVAYVCHSKLFQMDVKNTFLSGVLDEEVQMLIHS